MGATRTVNPLHFEDLEPHRFEDLVRQLAHGFRTWRFLEATGRLGRDEGIDIRGVELVQGETPESVDDGPPEETPAGEERAWTIQCKRMRSFGPADARGAVAQAVPDRADPPYGLVVAIAADATTETVLAFHEAARMRGVTESHLWTKGQLEDLLFQPESDHLLFAYFDISLVSRRRGRLADLRSRIGLKRKLLRALGKAKVTDSLFDDVLLRDIADDRYPYPPSDGQPPRWHGVQLDALHPLGLIVVRRRCEGWVKPDGTWDLCEALREDASHLGADVRRRSSDEDETQSWQARRETLQQYEQIVPEAERAIVLELRFVAFDDLVEVDPLGDPWYPAPHLFLREGAGPYRGGPFYRNVGMGGAPRDLVDEKRQPLFAGSVLAPAEGTGAHERTTRARLRVGRTTAH